MVRVMIQGTADESDITPYGQGQAARVRDALSRMQIDRSAASTS